MKIFITGCAKSGTTLLQRLFSAFKGVVVVPGEMAIGGFAGMADEGIIVAKRSSKHVFSNSIAPESILGQLRLIHAHDIKIVNIIRDGRDVVLSDNHAVLPPRWTSSILQSLTLRGFWDCQVTYEDLCSNPDSIQRYLSKTLGLEIAHKFSEYPAFVPRELTEGEQLYKARPISKESIGKDRGAYVDLCMDDERETFERCLRKYNYV